METVQSGSINKASEKLNINHQHLGRILSSLEDEIGAKLLERNRIGVTLTSEGLEILELMNNIDILAHQLKYYFSIDSSLKIKSKTLKIYNFAMTNYLLQNKFVMNAQKIMPNLMIETYEAANEYIIESLLNNTVASLGTLCSFDDYPTLKLNVDILPDDLEVISEKLGKVVMLISANNPIHNKYDSISIESLCKKPLVFYTPYDITTNHFYKLLKIYGSPHIKYKTGNLQSFYELLKNTDCVAIGGVTTNIEAMYNPLFNKEEQFRIVPVRENIQFKIIRIVNKFLKKESATVLRDIINKYFL